MKKERNEISFYHHGNIEIIRGRSFHTFPEHSHSAFCIGVVEDGCIWLTIQGQKFLLQKNDTYLIPPFTEHKITSVGNVQYGYAVLCLHSDFIEPYKHALLRKYVIKDERAGLKILNISKKFWITKNDRELEKAIYEFLNKNIEIISRPSRKTADAAVLSSIRFIREHLDEPFDLQAIADYAKLSKYYLLRLFKNETGVAPYQFYMQEKVKKVEQGLLKAQHPVHLAYDYHFSDQSHLCNTFKKHVGLTPLQYKRRCHGDTD